MPSKVTKLMFNGHLQKRTPSLKHPPNTCFKNSIIPEKTASRGPKPPMASQMWLGNLTW